MNRHNNERVHMKYTYRPAGTIPSCGYVVDMVTKQRCGAKPRYIIRFVGYDESALACIEHGAIVREWSDLIEIRSA